jgi:phosphohistidine phosphatase SixA
MALENVIIARHGDAASGGLSDFGREQIRKLGNCIKGLVSGSTFIAASPTGRTQESARIISDSLNAGEISVYDALECDYEDERAVLDLVKSRQKSAGTVILVTHAPSSALFARHISHEILGSGPRFNELSKGTAYHLNLSAKEWKILPSGILVYKMNGGGI